jgi:hypothetical protein
VPGLNATPPPAPPTTDQPPSTGIPRRARRWWIASLVVAATAAFIFLTSLDPDAAATAMLWCGLGLVIYPVLSRGGAPTSGYWSLGTGLVTAVVAWLWASYVHVSLLGSLDDTAGLWVVGVMLWLAYVLLNRARRLNDETSLLDRSRPDKHNHDD